MASTIVQLQDEKELNTPHYKSSTAVEIMKDFYTTAKDNSISYMSLEDINVGIN